MELEELKAKAKHAVKLMQEVVRDYPQFREGNKRICGLLDIFGNDFVAHAECLYNYVSDLKEDVDG